MDKKLVFQMEFGEILMLFRKRARVSKKKAADYIGKSVSTISNYEKGMTHPSYYVMQKFKELYGPNFVEALKMIEPPQDPNQEISLHVEFRDVGRIPIEVSIAALKRCAFPKNTNAQSVHKRLNDIKLLSIPVNNYIVDKQLTPNLYRIKRYLAELDKNRHRGSRKRPQP